MSSEQKETGEIPASIAAEPPLKKRAVTLYAIIIFKLIKGLLCLGMAFVLYHEAKKDMSQDFR
ncbi:MAG TPA: hypothetical protein VN765_03660, partial [Candidatus Acidoferrum sp.]|nr:hypothetical protein [Candidatus Acidoferrum sp.]